jgi:hypothetical protein
VREIAAGDATVLRDARAVAGDPEYTPTDPVEFAGSQLRWMFVFVENMLSLRCGFFLSSSKGAFSTLATWARKTRRWTRVGAPLLSPRP